MKSENGGRQQQHWKKRMKIRLTRCGSAQRMFHFARHRGMRLFPSPVRKLNIITPCKSASHLLFCSHIIYFVFVKFEIFWINVHWCWCGQFFLTAVIVSFFPYNFFNICKYMCSDNYVRVSVYLIRFASLGYCSCVDSCPVSFNEIFKIFCWGVQCSRRTQCCKRRHIWKFLN